VLSFGKEGNGKERKGIDETKEKKGKEKGI